MSRIGKQPLEIPQGVKINEEKNQLFLQGEKGSLMMNINPQISLTIDDKQITVQRKNNSKIAKSLHGLTQRLINNMIKGVTQGFEKKLEIKGVGYRAQMQGDKLQISVGYSHPVELTAPVGIKFSIEKNIITVSGIDKQLVGQTAAIIRAIRKPEPYKGKGIRYLGEFIKLKAGKAGKAAK